MNLTNEDRHFLRRLKIADHIDLGAAALPEQAEAEREIAELRRAMGEMVLTETERQLVAMRRDRDNWRRVALMLVVTIWAETIALWVLRWMR